MSAYCVDCNVKAVPERGPGTPLVIRHSEDCPNVTGKADSSPVETMDAPARPIPPEALNGLTGAAYSDVIRREAEGDWCAHVTLARIYREERDAALEGIIRRDDALGIYDDEVTKLHASLAERDATIERAKDVLFHCHADTCATELSPNAGYECTCWRGSLIEALQAADDRRAL